RSASALNGTRTLISRKAGMQRQIITALGVDPDLDMDSEIVRRVNFLVDYLHHTGAGGLVLGISGGVDSTVAGRLSQMAVEQYLQVNPQWEGTFMAVRLPHHTSAHPTVISASDEFNALD